MYQHAKLTCKACRVIVFAHQTDFFVGFLLMLPLSLLKFPNHYMASPVFRSPQVHGYFEIAPETDNKRVKGFQKLRHFFQAKAKRQQEA